MTDEKEMEDALAEILKPRVVEEWTVIDRWWTRDPIWSEWAEVDWGGRHVVMVRRAPDPTWRVHR
jgi:hypothetical protein